MSASAARPPQSTSIGVQQIESAQLRKAPSARHVRAEARGVPSGPDSPDGQHGKSGIPTFPSAPSCFSLQVFHGRIGLALDPVSGRLLVRLAGAGASVQHIRLRELSASALVGGDPNAADIAEAMKSVDAAVGVIFATPIYKASYSRLLKLFLDLMPQFGLAGKTVLAVATGGSLAHALALDYGLRPVLQCMGARHVIQSLLVPTNSLKIADNGIIFEDSIEAALNEIIYHMGCSIVGDTSDRS